MNRNVNHMRYDRTWQSKSKQPRIIMMMIVSVSWQVLWGSLFRGATVSLLKSIVVAIEAGRAKRGICDSLVLAMASFNSNTASEPSSGAHSKAGLVHIMLEFSEPRCPPNDTRDTVRQTWFTSGSLCVAASPLTSSLRSAIKLWKSIVDSRTSTCSLRPLAACMCCSSHACRRRPYQTNT